MKAKTTEVKEFRIVIADMPFKVYDKVKKVAAKEKRTIGKQAEIMLEELIEIKKL